MTYKQGHPVVPKPSAAVEPASVASKQQRRDELLQTVPGLGDKRIPQLLAYIGRPERFKSVKALIAYGVLRSGKPFYANHLKPEGA